MGHYVHMQVSFACDDYTESAVAASATTMLQALRDREDSDDNYFVDKDITAFLTSLAGRSGGAHCGPKGGLAQWGHIGNYSDGEKFVTTLIPFWNTILRGPHAPMDFERIVVFVEHEQSEQAEAWVISLARTTNEYGVPLSIDGLNIEHHTLPFAWGQM